MVLPVIGIADHNTLAGVVRAYMELEVPSRARRAKTSNGSRLVFRDGTPGFWSIRATAALMAGCASRSPGQAWRLDHQPEKGECHRSSLRPLGCRSPAFDLDAAASFRDGESADALDRCTRRADGVWLAASLFYRGDDRRRLVRLQRIASTAGVPLLIATNRVRYNHPARRPLQDVLTCIREKTTIDDHRQAARSQCGALSQAGGGNGAAVSRYPARRSRRPCGLPA